MIQLTKTNAPETNVRSISILGSTGSVGSNTVDLVRLTPERFSVTALSANRNVALLAEQARTLKAKIAVIADERYYSYLKDALSGSGVDVAAAFG